MTRWLTYIALYTVIIKDPFIKAAIWDPYFAANCIRWIPVAFKSIHASVADQFGSFYYQSVKNTIHKRPVLLDPYGY
jgi:hypothetical protein